MPIDIEQFEGSPENSLGGGPSQPERVLSFLAANSDKAFQPVEIARETDVPKNSINAVLQRLENRELVRHKGDYWAITDNRERLDSLTQYELTTRSMNDLYGEEDPGEWAEHMPERDENVDSNDE